MPHDTGTRTRGAAAGAAARSEHRGPAGRRRYPDPHHGRGRDTRCTPPGSPGTAVTPHCGCERHRKSPR
ncbi:hypothetical protein ABZ461_02180 [Actinacidiphila glaucinigra]|uniref:hypothetical protein n=1 Tax=Actinacidiphila glaucinigra TaxID=235986 RepID=UPI0033E2FE1C